MPNIVPFVLADSAAVNHTFSPIGASNGKAQWVNGASVTLRGREVLTIELKKPNSPNGAHRVHVTLGCPVETTVAGVTSVAHVNSFEGWFNFAQDGALVSRKDVLAKVRDLLGEAVFIEATTEATTYY